MRVCVRTLRHVAGCFSDGYVYPTRRSDYLLMLIYCMREGKSTGPERWKEKLGIYLNGARECNVMYTVKNMIVRLEKKSLHRVHFDE